MAENTDLYSEIDNVVNDEKNNVPVPDERKEALLKRLQELADQGNDFDPDRLEGIIALASGNTSDIAKSVLQRATEQKQKIDASNSGAEQEAPQSLYDNEVDTISQPSYNVRKEYERLSAKKDLTEEEKSTKQKIENDVEAYLSNVGDVNTDNVVAIMDYLAVSEMAGLDLVKERNESLSQKANTVVAEYDKENGLDSLEGKDSQFIQDNLEQWKDIASKTSNEELAPSSPYSDILNSLSDEEKGKMQEFMMMNTLHSLKVHSPSEFGENASKQLGENFGNASGEYALLINEEYLKQEAMDSFCKDNKIKPEELNAILIKAENGEKLSEKEQQLQNNYMASLKAHLEKAPSFTGPYKNQEFLRSAIVAANSVTISRLRDLDCRIAQKVNAPSASKEVTKENNSFAKKHPKLAMAVNMAKGMGISMAIGAAFGPVGLTAYSTYKTAGAIRKSYKRFKEQAAKDGKQGNVRGFIKHLFSREGRVEALSLAGSVAATCISGYFTFAPGLENLNLGMAGNLQNSAGTVVDAATQTAAETSSQGVLSNLGNTVKTVVTSPVETLKNGMDSILSSSRRTASMATSLGVGITKGVTAANNLRHARKQLAGVFKEAGVEIDKKTLRSLEGLSEKDFNAKLKGIAPDLTEDQMKQASEYIALANKSNPKSEFMAAVTGAAIGLAISSGTSAYSEVASVDAPEHTDESPTTGPEEIVQDSAPHTGDVIWQNEDMADQRFESFGIDAKGANEMLREMGIIKEGDNHFYRQSELNNLVNNSDLTGEQKLAIQEWANDRDARVDAMLKWQAEHPASVAPKPDLSVNMAPIFDEPVSTNPGDLPNEIPGTMYSVYGKTDGQSFQGVVLGDNPVEAGLKASEMFDENGILDKKSSITVRGDGVITEIEQKVKGDYTRTDVTTRDLEGDKLASQRIKSFDNDVTESKFKGDLDDDGKRDTVTRVTGADGASVSYTKFGNGERAVSYTDADGKTTEVTSKEMEENGAKHINSQLKNAYKEIAEDIRENNTNAQIEADAVSTADNTTPVVENITSVEENTTPTVENTSSETTAEVSTELNDGMRTIEGSNISYKVGDNGICVDGTLSGDKAYSLVPEATTENEGGRTVYKCGTSRSFSSSIAKQLERTKIQGLCVNQEVYNDLQNRVANGETLGAVEQKFMTQHEASLKRHGLEIKDGELTKASPAQETKGKGLGKLFKRKHEGR